MIGLLGPVLWLAAGALVAAFLVPASQRDRMELAALAVGLGLMIVTGMTLLGLLPPLFLVLTLALIVALVPLGLYVMHQRDGLPFLPDVPAAAPTPPAGPAVHGDRDAVSTNAADPAVRDDRDAAPAATPTPPRRSIRALALAVLPLLGVLLVAGYFRFNGLGYSEFQGDEARAMLLAARLTQSGDLGTLLWHKKGPLEVLLPAPGVKRGDMQQSTARLPFALAGLGVVLAGYALGRRLWGGRAGFAAALILALDGYLIAFSRIVQYQSVVALCSVLAVWCTWRWYTQERGGRVFLTLGALFLGFGTWAHYEAVLAAVPVAYLVASRARRDGWSAGTWLRRLAVPVLVGGAVTAAFYLPFVLHPQFAETFRYIAERRVGGAAPYNMLGDYFLRASFYNASYVVLVMLAALVTVIAVKLREALGRFGWLGVGTWLAALALVVLRPGLFEVGGRSWAILVFLPVLAVLLTSPTVDVRWRAVLLWFAVPFLAAGFLVQKPHTHFYTMVPAWALLVGWGADRVVAWLEGRWAVRPARVVALVAGAAFALVAGWYLQQVFIRQVPEYKRVYPEAAAPGYWLPYGDELPRGGYFGFPYRAGWNEVRALFADGTLQGSYDSNEELLITGWYTGGAVRCSGGGEDGPRYYLVSWRPQDEEDIPSREEIEQTHRLKATIRVHGQEKLWVYERKPTAGERADGESPTIPALVIDDAGGLLSVGGEASSFVDRPLPVSQALEWPLTQGATDVRFDHRLRLIGFDVNGLVMDDAAGGDDGAPPVWRLPSGTDRLGVVLAWEPYAPMDRDYKVLLTVTNPHSDLASAGGDMDGNECDDTPTTEWQMGERQFTGHVVRLSPEHSRAPGDYVLRLMLQDRATGAAATARRPDQATHTDTVDLLTFRVEAP